MSNGVPAVLRRVPWFSASEWAGITAASARVSLDPRLDAHAPEVGAGDIPS